MSTRKIKAPLPAAAVDFTIENYCTIFLIRCNTDRGKQFLFQAVEPDAQWFGDALAVERRFIGGLASSLREDGWTVR